MNKLTTYASSVILSIAAGYSQAAVLDVTATLSATISGAGTGTQTGTAVGTYDTDSQLLSLNSTYVVVNTGFFGGTMDQLGETLIDFSAMSGTNEVLDCSNVRGSLCAFVPNGPQTLASVSGTFESFVSVSTYLGATTTQNWEVTANEVPVPAAAWLFGTALLGLSGVARRRR